MDQVRTRAAKLLVVGTVALLTSLAVAPQPARAQLEEKLAALEAALDSLYDGSPVDLQECIRLAEIGSMSLGRLEEDVRTATMAKRAALAQWFPDLSASASWRKSEQTELDQAVTATEFVPYRLFDENGNPLPIVIDGEQAYVPTQVATGELRDVTIDQTFESQSITSNWVLFAGFDRIAERKQANADLGASVASLDYQRQILRENVTNAYYDLIRAQQRVQVAIDAEQLAQQELERSETYFELGISTKSDVLQAKVRHQQTKLDVVRERNGERNAFLVLAHAMNIPGARTFAVESTLPDVAQLQVPDLDPLLENARSSRLDLHATELGLEAAESGVTRARSGHYPRVTAFASYGRSVSETPFRFGGQENTSFSYGIQGSWAIFDRLRTHQQARNAVANKRRAEYDLRQKQLDVELEVVALWNNLVEATESYEVSVVSVEQSKEDLRLAEERFRVGAGTALDLITAQVNLARARRDLVDAQVNAIKFHGQLLRASGGTNE